jgi:hypothetical protein
MKRAITILLALCAALLFVFGLAGCSSSDRGETFAPMVAADSAKSEASYAGSDKAYYSGAQNGEVPQTYDSDTPLQPLPEEVAGGVTDTNRKLIWSGDLSMETTDHDSTVTHLKKLIEDCGGFIQNSSTGGGGVLPDGSRRLKSSSYTIRVPADKFDFFMNSSNNVATVLNSSSNAEDITDRYFDTEAHLGVLLVKEERLLDMLKTGGELEYLLKLERELSDTRYQIESLTGTLRKYDGLIEYSTVYVYLNEVREITKTPLEPETLGQKISSAFTSSLNGLAKLGQALLIFFIGYSPVLILTSVIVVVIFVVARKRARVRPRGDSDQDNTNSKQQ